MKPAFFIHRHLAKLAIAIALLIATAGSMYSENIQKQSSESTSIQLTESGCSPDNGLQCLFIGHSFFAPIAANIEDHALATGFYDHQQEIVFRGGPNGAPEALWLNTEARMEIQAHLLTGQVELLGMTYHPAYPEATGYFSWVQEALQYNTNTAFFIGTPWVPYPAEMSTQEMIASWEYLHTEEIYALVDTLRSVYPANNFYCIPYGQSANELRTLFEAGELPDIQQLTGQPQSSIYTDDLGHSGHMLRRLSELVWLGAIYQVDLLQYDYDAGFSTDLRPIAATILEDQDICYNCGGESICDLPVHVDLAQSNLSNTFTLFPNPVLEWVSVQTSAQLALGQTFLLSIRDAQGRLVQQLHMDLEQQISLSALEAGIYFYQISNANKEILAAGKIIRNK
ncbi:MAG: T9SS type A sorting domain-containing protein [Bacteroidota bacterium]